MRKASFGIIVAAALAAVGCGGAPNAEDFAGLYRGSGTTSYKNSDGQNFQDTENGWSESLTASVNSDKILLAGSCRLTATVKDELTFTIDPKDCDLGMGEMCHITNRVRSGTGTLSEDRKTLTLVLSGDWVQTGCLEAQYNETFTYTTSVKLTRQ